MKGKKKHIPSHIVLYSFMILTAIVFITPVILTMFQSMDRNQTNPLDGYRELFFNCFPFYGMLWNSVLYAISITFGSLIINVPAAFAFKFAKFRGKNVLYILYIILMMMPLQVMILPNYIGLRDLGVLNTRMAIILPLLFSPFCVVVLSQYLREVNVDVVEAARLETNSIILILWNCIVPQIKVCIAACALFVFADMWNMVEQPLLYVNDNKLRTLTSFIEQSELYNANVMFPASVMFTIPVLLGYLLFHEELKQGLKV